MIILLDVSIHTARDDLIGEPQFMKMKEKCPLNLTCDSSINVKHACFLSADDILHSTENNNESDAKVNGDTSAIRCDKCYEIPFEWNY